PALPLEPERGRGDAAVWLEWAEGRFTRGMLDASLADVSWAEGTDRSYERIGLSVEWLRTDVGWRVVLNDAEIARDGLAWAPNADTVVELDLDNGGGVDSLTVESTFVRLEDLSPLVAVLPDSDWARRWLALAPRGDVTNLELAARRG